MIPRSEGVEGWVHAAALAAAPWLARWQPWLAPAAVVLAVLLHQPWRRHRTADPWASLTALAVAVAAIAAGGAFTEAFAWLLLAAMVAGVAFVLLRTAGPRPDAADLVALVGYGGAFVLVPGLLDPGRGGWLAPAVVLVLARRVVPSGAGRRGGLKLGPPEREVNGELRLARVVAAGAEGLPRTAPLDLVLAPGESVAVLCDVGADAQAVAWTVAGRRSPAAGTVLVDGRALAPGERVVALAAPGESFVAGDLDVNLGALATGRVPRDTLRGVREACALDEVEQELGEVGLDDDGAPLDTHHRLLLAVARIIPSDFRIMVVVDPMPWVNAVRTELWRAAIVRASLGRTALWITPDRELASRADRVMELRHGRLRPGTVRHADVQEGGHG